MKKRLLFYVAFMMVALGSYAHDFEVDGMYYNIESRKDLTCSVTYRSDVDHGYTYFGDIIIPEKVIYQNKELTVTSIGERAFSYSSDLTSVNIPNSVTYIGEYAFTSCHGLTSINIPNSVTSIGIYAFWGCSGLTSVSIPNSVTYISGSAFHECSNMESCFIEDGEAVLTSSGGTFEKCPLRSVYIGRRLGDKHSFSPFAGCCSIKEVTFGRNITEIIAVR